MIDELREIPYERGASRDLQQLSQDGVLSF